MHLSFCLVLAAKSDSTFSIKHLSTLLMLSKVFIYVYVMLHVHCTQIRSTHMSCMYTYTVNKLLITR